MTLEIGFQLAALFPAPAGRIYIMHSRAHHRISISPLCRERSGRCIEKMGERPIFPSDVPFADIGDGCCGGDEGDDTCAEVKMYGPRAREQTLPQTQRC